MKIVGLLDEDMVNYKKCSMYIAFPTCSFKCDKECGKDVCQNSTLASSPTLEIGAAEICERYKANALSHAIVLGGLEPFDSPYDLLSIIDCFRNSYKIDDDIVIYTGYTEEELTLGDSLYSKVLKSLLENIIKYKNIIIKFGRYIPEDEPHFDEVLGVNLASKNQYAKKVS